MTTCKIKNFPGGDTPLKGDGVWVREGREREEMEGFGRVKVKEADLYSAFIEVPYTQGAQVQITQCYLQIASYLPLPRKHSPDGASQTEVADI